MLLVFSIKTLQRPGRSNGSLPFPLVVIVGNVDDAVDEPVPLVLITAGDRLAETDAANATAKTPIVLIVACYP